MKSEMFSCLVFQSLDLNMDPTYINHASEGNKCIEFGKTALILSKPSSTYSIVWNNMQIKFAKISLLGFIGFWKSTKLAFCCSTHLLRNIQIWKKNHFKLLCTYRFSVYNFSNATLYLLKINAYLMGVRT